MSEKNILKDKFEILQYVFCWRCLLLEIYIHYKKWKNGNKCDKKKWIEFFHFLNFIFSREISERVFDIITSFLLTINPSLFCYFQIRNYSSSFYERECLILKHEDLDKVCYFKEIGDFKSKSFIFYLYI